MFDGGEPSGWCDPHLKAAGLGLFVTNGYVGCLGMSQGAAIGIATAEPGRPVAIFTGDGAVGFNIGEFDTMVRHELPIRDGVDKQQLLGDVPARSTRCSRNDTSCPLGVAKRHSMPLTRCRS